MPLNGSDKIAGLTFRVLGQPFRNSFFALFKNRPQFIYGGLELDLQEGDKDLSCAGGLEGEEQGAVTKL